MRCVSARGHCRASSAGGDHICILRSIWRKPTRATEATVLRLTFPCNVWTMVFRVKDPATLDKVNPGDKVRFAADKVGGAIIVTQIEPAK